MPLGSLEDHLHDLAPDKQPLDWNTRMKGQKEVSPDGRPITTRSLLSETLVPSACSGCNVRAGAAQHESGNSGRSDCPFLPGVPEVQLGFCPGWGHRFQLLNSQDKKRTLKHKFHNPYTGILALCISCDEFLEEYAG
ncbi:hypothetical protein MLD38_009789 [Melastoma candidum]|uniref:Uncharacterized protein n=1 Tax=Melastoma candidum TaxID=119954 RepID=A0ACB9RZY7_9MYRT|nr:hypothetical protein MLD38_009789 [Melastoma candidum]